LLHLSILLETVRREGSELFRRQAARHQPRDQRVLMEPIEYLVIDVPSAQPARSWAWC